MTRKGPDPIDSLIEASRARDIVLDRKLSAMTEAVDRTTQNVDRALAGIERSAANIERSAASMERCAGEMKVSTERIERQVATLTENTVVIENRIIRLEESLNQKLDRIANDIATFGAIASQQATTCDRLATMVEKLLERN